MLSRYVRSSLKASPLFKIVTHLRNRRLITAWEKKGCPVPPPEVIKQTIVKAYARRYGLRTLVETGTYTGDMVNAVRNVFDHICSIEIDEDLFEKAKERFQGSFHITILLGDSASVLPQVLQSITGPCLFWLDGHYCGEGTGTGILETPIVHELEAILQHSCSDHVVLIDDARLFTGTSDYPTVEELKTARAEFAAGLGF